MPSVKGKGGSTAHRYRPASEYDDATLAQKREYWRTKKREQRARLSDRRGKATQDRRGESKVLHLIAPAEVNSSLSSSLAASSSPLQNESDKSANISGSTLPGPLEATEKEKWLQTMKLNKVSPQLPASCPSRADVKSLTARVNSAVTSPSGAQLNTSSSVPPVRVSRFTNSTSANSTPQPRVSMQGASVPKLQHKAQVAVCIQPKLLSANVPTSLILVSSPCGPVSDKTQGEVTKTPPQIGTNSALVTNQRAKGVSPESEEERAAKRREQWRIKKREQRAKLAARVAKARERAQGTEVSIQTAQKRQHSHGVAPRHLPPQSLLRAADQKQYPALVRTSFTRRGNVKLQTGGATLDQQVVQIKVQNQHGIKAAHTAIAPNVINEKKPVEPFRKFSSHLSSVTRGITRCKTPRQRFIEAQRNFMNQRNIRVKSPSLSFVYGSRNIPRIDPNDTPEQIIAKRREYWRLKKREQRAKLSAEMKARLKEKDSLMRRVKRYQKILDDMRKARAMTQSGGSTLTHASETIGGFIKEDGTVTINIPLDHNKSEEEQEEHVDSNNSPINQSDIKQRGGVALRVNPPPPPLHPAQVKASVPLTGQSVNKPPRLMSIRPRTQLETANNSHSLSIRTVGSQLTLTHPQKPQNAGSGESAAGPNLGGCVMKMAVSSSAPSLSAACLDPELTEEERMAKKREYWRVKKREQRAARAARLKQGILQARANAALQRRKAHKLVTTTAVLLSRRPANQTGSAQSLPNSREPVLPHANEIKQESEFMPAVDLNSQPEQAICPDIKPSISQTPPPAPQPQPEPDPALNPDSQATTLLAVASMKKLLEESLSTVTGCQTEQTDIKIEATEQQDVKPDLPQICFEKDDAADLTLQIKSWQEEALVQEDSPSPHLKDSSQISETLPPLPTSDMVAPQSTSENSSQTPSSPSSPRRTQRLRAKKVGHQNCCSPEPPKLHHLPTEGDQHQCEAQGQHCMGTEQSGMSSLQSGMSSLQKKREYWKLMKRQQRARLKARQKNRQEGCGSVSSPRNVQSAGFVLINTAKGLPVKPALLPKPSVSSATAVTSIPTVLVVSPTTSTTEQPDTLQVKLPVTSREQNNVNVGPSQTDCVESPEAQRNWRVDRMLLAKNQQEARPVSPNVDLAPSLPTLKPPENPLSSINLQPIEPPCQTSSLSPIKIPCVQPPSAAQRLPSPTKLSPVSTMVPPKPIPGESEEDFLKRKREYWRIKKKEQRARKAIQDKGFSSKRAPNNWRPILPSQSVPAQESNQWVNSSEESDSLINSSADTDAGSFSYPNYTAPIEDESDLLFDYESHNGEEGPVSDDVWRNHYLMDYDPLNQLLVCMVCGELQYLHSLEGVKAHIEEAHPDTMSLEPGERQRILEAWDEQVSQRERFFTSQLQQHSGALTEAHRN